MYNCLWLFFKLFCNEILFFNTDAVGDLKQYNESTADIEGVYPGVGFTNRKTLKVKIINK